MTGLHCLHCRELLRVYVSSVPPSACPGPQAGDFAFCLNCGGVQAVNEAGDGVRGVSGEEWNSLASNREFMQQMGQLLFEARQARAQRN